MPKSKSTSLFSLLHAIVENPPSIKEREEREEEIIQYIDPVETNIIPAFSTSSDINLSFGIK
ncbi:15670_t:CDS:2 [Entrophospora sp. SA101]|nr:15670_t:CDS:2 [Entrophospora sp. SA101]